MRLCLILFLVLSILGCGKQEQKPTDLVTFPLRGKIVAIDTARHRVMIAHHEIPNYMMAMTMPFRVKNNALMQEVQPGDSIVATLAVSREESWLETVKVIQKGEQVEPMSPEAIKLKHLFQPGEALPDDALLNQDGKTIRLGDYKGKVLALTFIYSRCPLPDFCIRMSNHFARIQQTLSKDRELNGKWHLISISFDPKFDSPKVLKEYGKSYKADFSTWEFATDPDTSGKTIMRLADGLDLTYAEDEGLIQHNLRTVLIDKEGKLAKVISGNEWKPEDVVGEIKKLTIVY
jgi:protein SCO1/2